MPTQYPGLAELIPNLRSQFGTPGQNYSAIGAPVPKSSGSSGSSSGGGFNWLGAGGELATGGLPTPLALSDGFDWYDALPGGQLLSGLFGGSKKKPKPKENFYGSPFRQPGVPIFNPETGFFVGLQTGENDPLKPVKPYSLTKVEGTAANQTRALLNNLPAVMAAINAQILPNELSQLQASAATSGPYAELQRGIFRNNALASANVDKDILLGPGADIVSIANQLQRSVDPEFYSTRESSSRILEEMLNNPLTGGEEAAIERNLNRENIGTGGIDRGGQLQTISNAIRYGGAARDRQGAAIDRATQFLPASRSGVDVLQQAIKSPSAISGAFSNVREQSGQQAVGVGGQQASDLTSLSAALRKNDKPSVSTLDKITQVLGAVDY